MAFFLKCKRSFVAFLHQPKNSADKKRERFRVLGRWEATERYKNNSATQFTRFIFEEGVKIARSRKAEAVEIINREIERRRALQPKSLSAYELN